MATKKTDKYYTVEELADMAGIISLEDAKRAIDSMVRIGYFIRNGKKFKFKKGILS